MPLSYLIQLYILCSPCNLTHVTSSPQTSTIALHHPISSFTSLQSPKHLLFTNQLFNRYVILLTRQKRTPHYQQPNELSSSTDHRLPSSSSASPVPPPHPAPPPIPLSSPSPSTSRRSLAMERLLVILVLMAAALS